MIVIIFKDNIQIVNTKVNFQIRITIIIFLFPLLIFMIIMIINYSIGLSVEFIDNMYSAFRMRTTIILLGIIVFSSVIYLKSQKLSELKRAQSSEGLSARKKLDELGCGFLLIGAIFLLWALLMISWSLAAAALIIIIIFVIVKIFKGSSWKKTKDEIP